MAEGSGGSFTFPSLPKPRPLPARNPLLAHATVTDRTAAAAGGPAPLAAGGADQPPAAGAQQQPGGAYGGRLGAGGDDDLPPPPVRGRKKVPFEKGFSQVDWVRVTQTHPDLAGLGPGGRPRRGITMEEVAQHASPDDCWTVLRGRVYNMTPYLRFHPGGVPLLLKIAGRDGTALFTKYHAWVNYDFLLAKCLVGMLAPPSAAAAAPAPDGGGAAAAPEHGADAAPGAPVGVGGSSSLVTSGGSGGSGMISLREVLQQHKSDSATSGSSGRL